jgi:hypothetical protein
MRFTFGIVTGGDQDIFIHRIIDSIEENNIPEYEIFIIGKFAGERKNTYVIPFDESVKKGWITKKKNLVARLANYENLVLMHDYVCLELGWYQGFLHHGDDFNYLITPIRNPDGSRALDYTLTPFFHAFQYPPSNNQIQGFLHGYFMNNTLLPYSCKGSHGLGRYMYISGAYYVIKTKVALEHPLDERRIWGQAEDMEYAIRLHRAGYFIECNPRSPVRFFKQKDLPHWARPAEPFMVSLLKGYCDVPEFHVGQNAVLEDFLKSIEPADVK